MNRLFSLLLLAALFSGAAFAAADPAPADAVAQRMTVLSARQEVAADDARMVQARTLLGKAMKLTQEEAVAIEAAPLELLEALSTFGKAGQPMRETLQSYVAARKAAPARSHAEAMEALGKKK